MAVLSEPPSMDGSRKKAAPTPVVSVPVGMRLTHRATRFTGVVTDFRDGGVEIEGGSGDRRLFRMIDAGFLVEGRAVSIVPSIKQRASPGPRRTASGSVAVVNQKARVARASRIWVEGIHDAELVEKVWGDDLRVEGVVVERLDGVDDLVERLLEADVSVEDPTFRVGVLVDHLVAGSKEQKIAQRAMDQFPGVVMVLGHPYIDVWQAVHPSRIGLSAWPTIPRGRPWKEGVCEVLGLGESWMVWKQLLAGVRTYADLDSSLVGAVEQLIDFVCEPPEQ
jgi:Protein of unknown function (DUF3097)